MTSSQKSYRARGPMEGPSRSCDDQKPNPQRERGRRLEKRVSILANVTGRTVGYCEKCPPAKGGGKGVQGFDQSHDECPSAIEIICHRIEN